MLLTFSTYVLCLLLTFSTYVLCLLSFSTYVLCLLLTFSTYVLCLLTFSTNVLCLLLTFSTYVLCLLTISTYVLCLLLTFSAYVFCLLLTFSTKYNYCFFCFSSPPRAHTTYEVTLHKTPFGEECMGPLSEKHVYEAGACLVTMVLLDTGTWV